MCLFFRYDHYADIGKHLVIMSSRFAALDNAEGTLDDWEGIHTRAFEAGSSFAFSSIFAWPGLGMLAFESLFARDLNLLLGIFLLSSALVVVVNLVVDVIYCSPGIWTMSSIFSGRQFLYGIKFQYWK